MKFLITKELHHNPLLKVLILFFVAILTLFLFSDILIYHYQIGLTPTLAEECLRGDIETYTEPILFDVLLERVHISIFTSMITLMLLSIIYMRVYNIEKSFVIHLGFISAILSPITLILSYFYGNIFIVLWISSFLFWHMIALYFSFRILLGLLIR